VTDLNHTAIEPSTLTVQAPSPLGRIRVLDVAQVLAGPYCALLLADLGCDVIKVEQPGVGDSSRHSLGPLAPWGESSAFLAANRNKRSICLNLKKPGGRDAFLRLVRTADVLVESYRPGTTRRLGIDYETLSQINPRLIYASISGFGSTGPYADRGGYDIIAQGMSGIMSVTGDPNGDPAKAGVPITDIGAALICAVAILGALLARSFTGDGQYVETSLFEAGIAYAVWEATELWSTDEVPLALGSAHRMAAPYQAIRVKDGHITIGANNDKLWRAAAAAFGHSEWTEDPRFSTNSSRLANRVPLIALIEGVTMSAPSEYWLDKLHAAGVPTGPVYDYAQVFQDPQTIARGMVTEVLHPLAGMIKMLGVPWKGGTTAELRRPPTLGEHTDEILREIECDEDELLRLRADGAIQ
jgi:crotonobetainyl-CoA:carnitine CoA-transferase CaiB-like acyl-CoA transferase